VSFRTANGSEDWDQKRKYKEILERADKITRAEIARKLLVPDGGGWVDRVLAKHEIEVVGFTQEIGEMPRDSESIRNALQSPINSAIFGTDIRLPLIKGLEQSADRSKILGIVLVTDGQHNWGQPPVAKSIELGQRELPIYPIVIGPRTGPPDIAVVRVQGPASVFQKTDASIEARVMVSNMPIGKVKVTLTLPDAPDGTKRDPLVETIIHDGKNHAYTLRFSAKMEDAGTLELKVTAEFEPVGANGQKEEFTANNSGSVRVNVAPDKAKVLVIDGEARWEFHYLTTALVRDPTMDVQSIVFRQPRLNKANDANSKKLLLPDLKLPTDPDAFLNYDCIILGDVSPEDLPKPERERLEKYVSERGGTLVMVAGKRWMPWNFIKGGTPEADLDPLVRLLPIQNPKVMTPELGFPMTLTGEGRMVPFLRMESTADLSLERWTKLPDHFWGVVGKAKEGAVPLAFYRANGADIPKSPDALRNEERDNALMVRQNYGFGRVLFVGLESTWRWRFKTGDQYHHRFWGQVIRWAATDKPLITGDDNIRFGTREPVYRQDQEVEFVARLGEKMKKPTSESLMGARAIRLPTKDGEKEQVIGLIPLRPNEFRPRELSGSARDLPPGEYVMELVLPDLADELAAKAGPAGDPTKMRAKFKVLPPDSAEMVELSPNWPLMEEIAAKSGGQVYTPETADELIEKLESRSVTRETREVNRLWQSWWTLILFLVLITTEWGMRKWVGLP